MVVSFLSRFFRPKSPDAEARRLVRDGALLLDVRSEAEFAGGHLRTSLNIPVKNLAARVGELNASRHIVVYCRSGIRSRRAAQILRAEGFEVYDMGRHSAWGTDEDENAR